LQVDSSNVPRAPQQCKQGPAPACSYGYQYGPSYDNSTCSWNYSCIPQSAMPPASVCVNGFAYGPTFNASSNSWNYSCIPQSAMPPASVCVNGFAYGPTFNASSNSWSYSCKVCTDVAQTPVACSTAAGTYGIPAGATAGNASWTKNSCSGAITYTGGCSFPYVPSYTPAPTVHCYVSKAGKTCWTGGSSGYPDRNSTIVGSWNNMGQGG
jgi:hypothetical protein